MKSAVKLFLPPADTALVSLFPHGYAETVTHVTTLRTPRLRLRGWRSSDVAELRRIRSHPEVARFLPGDAPSNDTLATLHDPWVRFGFGPWAVEWRETGRFIGMVGLLLPGHWPKPEMTWVLDRQCWGQGIATEAAAAATEFAFDVCSLPELIAVCLPGNRRSERVMQKLGMTRNDVVTCVKRSIPITQYRLTEATWRAARSV